jgi:hypothetical protein
MTPLRTLGKVEENLLGHISSRQPIHQFPQLYPLRLTNNIFGAMNILRVLDDETVMLYPDATLTPRGLQESKPGAHFCAEKSSRMAYSVAKRGMHFVEQRSNAIMHSYLTEESLARKPAFVFIAEQRCDYLTYDGEPEVNEKIVPRAFSERGIRLRDDIEVLVLHENGYFLQARGARPQDERFYNLSCMHGSRGYDHERVLERIERSRFMEFATLPPVAAVSRTLQPEFEKLSAALGYAPCHQGHIGK